VLCRAFIQSGTLATREPHSLCTGNGKRPDGVTQVPWSRGRCLAWDATCSLTFWPAVHVLVQRQQQQNDEIAEVRWHHNWRRFLSFCDRDIGNLGRAGLSPRHGDRPPTGNCDQRTTVNSVSSSASFGGGSARQRLLCDGEISALELRGHWDGQLNKAYYFY